VQWEGVLPRDVVQLEYSLNKGVLWDTLAKNVLNLKHSWQVPDIESNEVMFRVLQLWPNNIGKTLNLNHNLEQLNSAFFSPDGNYIITCSDGIIVRLWNW
jgi:WD40 repeat protein